MTSAEMTTRVKVLLQNEPGVSDADIQTYLDIAGDAVLDRLYPYGAPETCSGVPARYLAVQCELTARYIARAGALGQLGHTENGISRSWESPDDMDILGRVIPIAKVM